jgi:hypothetical protein
MRSRLNLREDPQLKEKNPQLIPIISQVVRPLQAYIRRPLHVERGEIVKYQTFDLIRKISLKHQNSMWII